MGGLKGTDKQPVLLFSYEDLQLSSCLIIPY